MTSSPRIPVGLMAGLLGAVALLAGCGGGSSAGGTADAASKVYVAPGDYDDFYFFASGGFSGQLDVYGLPSGRLIKIVPIFSQWAENGWGYNEETKAMLQTSYGFVPWGDAHHPELSQTDGVPDGRWLFINENNTPRIARIDLTTFETDEIIEIPNSAGNHASPFVTMNTDYAMSATRFSVPTPQKDVSIQKYKEEFAGVLTFVKVDHDGRMDIAFQIKVPGYDYDLSHAGKGPSDGWAFFTSYNSEQANSIKEVNASQNDKDYIAAVHWKRAEECVANGQSEHWNSRYAHNYFNEDHIAVSEMKHGVTIITPQTCSDLVYYLPTPKSPHGVDVDPSGTLIAAGGKLATVIPVHSFDKILKAIAAKDYVGDIDGIPILRYESIVAGEVENPGLGPLHTEFDGKGYAYTSAFISSEIVKWSLKTFKVVDRIPTYYSIGHLSIPGGDTRKPWGQYVIALNKMTKDRYLPTGPELAHAAQLIDITGDKMKLLLDFPTMGEPHYAQALPASMIMDKQVKLYPIEENNHPDATKSEADAHVVRKGTRVDVYMTAIRSHFMPDNIEGIQVGDSVYFHVTNLEQDWDVPHGFAVIGARTSELLVMPGETRTLVWVPQRTGVYPFYCTDFCSALHQEMQGYARVSARGSRVPVSFNTP